tara:strand:- start:9262 stop:10188 length:927 start_codon:yes stop_codon:yes gene_type:complete
MNKENLQNFDDEINLKDLFLALWNKKILISSITTSAAIIAVLYSLSLPNIYISNALLAPTSSEDSLSSKLGGYSSLAGLAGLGLPADSGSKSMEAIERIRSYDFFVDQFIPNIKFENLVAAKNWTKTSNVLNYDLKVFNKTNNEWVSSDKAPFLSKPSYQEAYEIYREILTISEDKKTSFISISIEHISPFIAERWLKLIIQNINNHMRELDKSIAQNSIDFLNITAQKTNLSEMKVVIFKLVESQVQTLTLAEANKDYIFKAISSPIAPEKKSKPSRASISILLTLLGFMTSIIISLLLHYFNFKKN